MENYKIFTEVTADLTAEMVNELNIEVIQWKFLFLVMKIICIIQTLGKFLLKIFTAG